MPTRDRARWAPPNRKAVDLAAGRARGDHRHMDTVQRDARGRLDHLHRVGAVVFGIGLGVFGVLGLVNRLDMFSTTGRQVFGLSTNGALSIISVVVAGVLIAAGVRGGRTASTVLVIIGAAFVLSGFVNALL